MSSENIDLVRRSIAALNASLGSGPADQPYVDGFFAEEAEVWPAPEFPEGGPFRGREQIRRFIEGIREGWKPGTAVVPRELEESGDKVLVSFEWRATGEATGIEMSSDWLALHTLRGGQIVRLQFFSDRDAAINAAGLK